MNNQIVRRDRSLRITKLFVGTGPYEEHDSSEGNHFKCVPDTSGDDYILGGDVTSKICWKHPEKLPLVSK